jgi:hypothetical protein
MKITTTEGTPEELKEFFKHNKDVPIDAQLPVQSSEKRRPGRPVGSVSGSKSTTIANGFNAKFNNDKQDTMRENKYLPWYQDYSEKEKLNVIKFGKYPELYEKRYMNHGLFKDEMGVYNVVEVSINGDEELKELKLQCNNEIRAERERIYLEKHGMTIALIEEYLDKRLKVDEKREYWNNKWNGELKNEPYIPKTPEARGQWFNDTENTKDIDIDDYTVTVRNKLKAEKEKKISDAEAYAQDQERLRAANPEIFDALVSNEKLSDELYQKRLQEELAKLSLEENNAKEDEDHGN